jgi:hypothetical protein
MSRIDLPLDVYAAIIPPESASTADHRLTLHIRLFAIASSTATSLLDLLSGLKTALSL